MIPGFLGYAEHLDRAVVLNIHRRTGFFSNRSDRRSTLTDDIPDLVGIHLQLHHAGSILGNDVPGTIEDRVHLTKNMESGLHGLLQGDLHDLLIDTLNLDIHLQGSDTTCCASDLEIHIAQVILITQNIRQNRKLVALFDQPHRDTRNRRLDRHTGGHQCQGSDADGGHGT